MNKVKGILATIILVVVMVFVFSQKYKEVQAAYTENEVLNAYAYQISIIKYTGGGEPTPQGRPILVYNPIFLEDFVVETGGEVPTDYENFSTDTHGISQIIDEKTTSTLSCDPTTAESEIPKITGNKVLKTCSVQKYTKKEWTCEKQGTETYTYQGGCTQDSSYCARRRNIIDCNTACMGNGNCGSAPCNTCCTFDRTCERWVTEKGSCTTYTGTRDKYGWSNERRTTGLTNCTENIFKECNASTENKVYVECVKETSNYYYETDNSACHPQAAISDATSRIPESGNPGYTYKIFKYESPRTRITYKRPDTSMYYGLYADEGLTEENVLHHDYLDKVKEEYAGSVEKVKRYFGIDIRPYEIEQYYVEFRPVERIKDSYTPDGGRYLIKSYAPANSSGGVAKWQESWNYNSWTSTYHPDTMDCNPHDCNCSTHTYSTDCDKNDYKPGSTCTTYNQHGSGFGGCYSICTWQSCNTCYDPCNNAWTGYNLSEKKCGVIQRHDLYGKTAIGSTSLRVVTDASNSKINRAMNYCNEEKNRHCIMDENTGKCTGVYEYYVGPDLQRAIAGTESYNKYKLSGECTRLEESKGVRHYYLVDLGCSNVCTGTGANNSDDFLKCIENFCDAEVDYDLRGNARNRKKNCMINCGYTYGKVGESKDSCNNSNPYKGLDNIVNGTSSCNKDGASGKYMPNIKSVVTECVGDKVTDFDNNDGNDTIFDQRTYINRACKNTTYYDYKDTSNISVIAGEGIDYTVTMYGEKECQTYFNLEQWKFDYATIPSKDPIRRNRLDYILEVYNNQIESGYKGTSSRYYIPKSRLERASDDFYDNKFGEIDWNSKDGGYNYNGDNVSVKTKVKEVVEGENKETNTLNLVVTKEYSDSPVQSVYGNERITKVNNLNITNNIAVNRYISTSTLEREYGFASSCISTDGKATIYKPNDYNVCYTKKIGDKSVTEYGQNKYYTNLKATTGKKHIITTEVEAGASNKYNNKESCNYNVKEKDAKCMIRVNPNTTTMLGDGLYEGRSVTLELYYDEKLGVKDNIISTSIKVNNNETQGETRTISNIANNSVQTYYIEGILRTKSGEEIKCDKTMTLLTRTGCGIDCALDKNGETLYTIRSTGSTLASRYYSFTSNSMGLPIEEILSKTREYSYMKKVIESVVNGKRYIRLNTALNEEILFGYVTNESGSCNNYCRTDGKSRSNCETLYKPADRDGIYDYCAVNYRTDINNYESQNECVEVCSAKKCPNNRRDYNVVANYCKAYSALGYSKIEHCINSCYYVPESDGYMFRSIDVNDPFPDSEEKRIVGQNWVGLEEYITNDKNDTTTITGDNANINVEYVIDLSPADIRKIREDTKNGGRSSFTELAYTSDTKKSVVGQYKSKFIREEYNELFKTNHGNKMAIYNPNVKQG